jgi:tRNA-dihydrouridine synthase B
MNNPFTFMSAPIDGVLDSPARQMIRKFSKKNLLFGEMRHIACVANEKNNLSVRHNPIEQPLAFQVSAHNTNFLEEAVEKIIEHKFVELNLNAGCPAKNIIKFGAGSALMSKPDVLKTLMLSFKKAIAGRIPFTLKIRAGYKEKNALEIAKLAQDCGIEALSIHPRTQPAGFAGPLDFELVKKITASLSIPVIFSGEIKSYQDAQDTYEKTGVDQFMVGRALWGAPWKLHEIQQESQGKTFSISIKEIIELALKHLALSVDFYGPSGVQSFKSHLARYIKGITGAATLRRNLLTIDDHKEMKQALNALIDSLN